MSDTIELLEVIGRDSSLRHAPAAELTRIMQQRHTSAALTAAVASGDRTHLSGEFGDKPMEPPQSAQGPWREEDEPDQQDEPHQPPSPGHDKTSTR